MTVTEPVLLAPGEHLAPAGTRPYWQTAECPSWCGVEHQQFDFGDRRRHASRCDWLVPLTLVEPKVVLPLDPQAPEGAGIPKLGANVMQYYRHVEPTVMLRQRQMGMFLPMTVAEARAAAELLTRAADVAEGLGE